MSADIRKPGTNDIASIANMKLQMFEEAGVAMGMNEGDLNQFYKKLYAEKKPFITLFRIAVILWQ